MHTIMNNDNHIVIVTYTHTDTQTFAMFIIITNHYDYVRV